MSEIKWSDPTHFTDKHALSMTLRDYFAAKAMQSLIINNDSNSAWDAASWVGTRAYEVADAMLIERNKA